MPPETTDCTVPAGRERARHRFSRFIAYGGELNLVQPPRPKDPKQPWEQIWAVKVRLKSTAGLMLAEGMGGDTGGRAERASTAPANPTRRRQNSPREGCGRTGRRGRNESPQGAVRPLNSIKSSPRRRGLVTTPGYGRQTAFRSAVCPMLFRFQSISLARGLLAVQVPSRDLVTFFARPKNVTKERPPRFAAPDISLSGVPCAARSARRSAQLAHRLRDYPLIGRDISVGLDNYTRLTQCSPETPG